MINIKKIDRLFFKILSKKVGINTIKISSLQSCNILKSYLLDKDKEDMIEEIVNILTDEQREGLIQKALDFSDMDILIALEVNEIIKDKYDI